MPLTMNKRSSGTERPRSARRRKKPSLNQDSDADMSSPESFTERGQSETNRKNTKSKPEMNLLDTSNRLGPKNNIFGAKDKLTVSGSVEMTDPSIGVVNFYQRQGREPPKSPRILPKLEKNRSRKANAVEESPTGKDELPQFPIFVHEKNRVDGGSLQLGKHYSVLPNISHNSEETESNNILL